MTIEGKGLLSMIMQTKEQETAIDHIGDQDKSTIPAELPILPLRQTVVYPSSTTWCLEIGWWAWSP
jgi:hypothetical protein